MKKYKCPCGYIYDPEDGCTENRIPAGTLFEDLPKNWICTHCGYEKEYFKKQDGDEKSTLSGDE